MRIPNTPTAGARGGDPVAIIGAGVAGLTAAYRLLQAGIPCEIFEESERAGGRILTKYDFNKDAMFCELGGELVDTNHADLIALAGELGVGIQELKGEDKGVDLYFFGGKHYSDEQLIPPFQPFAKKLAADFEGIYDAEQNFTEKAGKFDRMSLAAYLTETDEGVEKWVVDMLRVAYTKPKYKFTRGSYACPLLGQYTTLLKAAPEPELDGRLIFAGEHTSADFFGFMNGAVQSGNRAAKEILESKKSELQKAA